MEAPPGEQERYDELRSYTLAHADPAFVHQYVVDAWAAQHADASKKPITVAFALAGLCLHLEQGYHGREVQNAHMRLAQRKQAWPTFALPEGPRRRHRGQRAGRAPRSGARPCDRPLGGFSVASLERKPSAGRDWLGTALG